MSLRRSIRNNPILKQVSQLGKKTKTFPSSNDDYRAIELAPEIIQKISNLIPIAGYLLLTLTFLDYLALLIPLQFFNPNWELNIIGQLVESVWAPILGFLLVFYRLPPHKIRAKKLKLMSIVSWLILLLAIVYFLSIPLIISDTFRINQINFAQVTQQADQQKTQVAEMKQQLSNLSDNQVTNIFAKSPLVSPKDSSETMKGKLLTKLEQEQSSNLNKATTVYQQQKQSLFKNSFKWIIGAFLSGCFFITFWKSTDWTRKMSV
jgi:large-conductance mechanosensitive channel